MQSLSSIKSKSTSGIELLKKNSCESYLTSGMSKRNIKII